jgi:hypothetical protein
MQWQTGEGLLGGVASVIFMVEVVVLQLLAMALHHPRTRRGAARGGRKTTNPPRIDRLPHLARQPPDPSPPRRTGSRVLPGTRVDPLTLAADIVTVVTIDAALYDELFGEIANVNAT